MSQAIVRRIMGDEYTYRNIMNMFEENNIQKYRSNYSKRMIEKAKGWNQELNSEWTVRNYKAVKMILSATLLYNSLVYSNDRNLKITEPYLKYYTLLSAARALMFTLPSVEWSDGHILEASHTKIISEVSNCVKSIDKVQGQEIESKLKQAKANRELFSYAFPSDGFSNRFSEISSHEVEDIAITLIEIAQFNSEILEKLISKHAKAFNDVILDEYFNKAVEYYNAGDCFVDGEDYYRMGYITRKQPFPLNLSYVLTEGMVEDYFSTWWDECCEDDDTLFNPDTDIRVLFDFP